MTQMEYRLLWNGSIDIGGTQWNRGRALGDGNNCLIDTLRQACGNLAVSTSRVRTRLQQLFSEAEVTKQGLEVGAIVTAGNYLELQHHWKAVVDLLFKLDERRVWSMTHANVTIKCVDLMFEGNGEVVGTGPMVLYIAREHGNHFIPLFKQQASRTR